MRKFLLLFMAMLSLTACHFIASFSDDGDDNIQLSFDKNNTSLLIGEMDIINLTASEKQNSARITWEYDSDMIYAKTDNYSCVITALKSGSTTVTARCGSNSASCVLAISSENYAVTIANPYVYASADYVDVQPNSTVKISASLFGGTSADIDGFTWSIDKPSVAGLSTEGNYCWITGQVEGIAKLTVKHNKAAYGYSVLVNCSSDGTNVSYITTSDNIITINKSETETAEFSVDLRNSVVSDYAGAFTYDTVDELGNSLFGGPVNIESANGSSVTLRANSVGNCFVRVSHPNAVYSLDILVRVIENAETGYIEPSETIMTVGDSAAKKLTLSLANYDGDVDSSLFTWEFSDNADDYITYELLNGDDENTGDSAYIKGVKTGSVKIVVSYPGLSSRCVIILVRDVTAQAADVTTYLTTSQNYIRMSMNDLEYKITATLKNCSQGDVSNLKWSITNYAADGSKSDVIKWTGGSGSSVSSYGSRAAIALDYSEFAYAVITPVTPGTAYIEVSHPKAVYKTSITVVVTENETTADNTILSLTGLPSLKVKNGETPTLTVSLTGTGSADDIVWQATDGGVQVTPSGASCVISTPAEGSGITRNTVTASYPATSSVVTFTVVTYDTEEEAESIALPCIYTLNPVISLKSGLSGYLYLERRDISDPQNILWSVISGSDVISLVTMSENSVGEIYALSSGKAQIKVSYAGCDDIIFTITVTENGVIDASADCYLSTTNNVVYFSDINEIHEISVQSFNISESVYSGITYECSSTLFEVSGNGTSCTITSLASDAEATLTIRHPLSLNELVVYLKSGSQYVYVNEDIPYITSDKDVVELYAGQEEVTVYATLNHTEESDETGITKGFSFTSTDEGVATVSFVNYSNACYVKPVANGTCRILITHPDAQFEKEVVVVVKQASDATSIPYITTDTNVITVIQGDYTTALVSLENSDSINSTYWHWSSSSEKIAAVVANNGTSAMICANGHGTTQIKVTHDECPYALNIIVVVLDASVTTSRPYISVSDTIINLAVGGSASLTAEMIGGSSSASDANYFKFYSSNSGIALVTSASGSAYVRGVTDGMAYITVSNSRYTDSYSRTVLVIVEDSIESGVYISSSQNIVKLKPDDTSLTTITATLVNGEETDAENFIWWADDYNLVSITSIAGTCSVAPVGKSGTTKIHVKHEKAQKQCDILVLVSKYDDFAFSTTSASIVTEKLYFYPLQIPAMDTDYSVEYSSSNPDICIIEGSNAVAWVCALDYGTASLTATLLDSNGSVISTAEMLVTVSVTDTVLPVISLGNSILTVEEGTSQTLTAIITGDSVEDTEKYNLKWSVKNKDSGISFLNETADKTVYGSDCYVTFERAGQYVISVTHEKSGAETDLYIVVEEKGKVTIELNSSLETVFKDDGSFTLTATLINGTSSDYKNIEWSAVKVGGQNIVSVSKTNGQNCTVTPKNIGQTSVIARLPNGEYAKCIVVVKAATEISLDLGTVHVNPGYTQVVNYKTNPTNATINWYTQMTTSSSSLNGTVTNYFSIEDDTAQKQLRITGLKDYEGGAAGTISAIMVGASSANLPKITVYVEYTVELELLDSEMNTLTQLPNNWPDTKNEKSFYVKYQPTDLDIDIFFGSTRLQCITDASTDNQAAKNHTSIGDCPNNLFTIASVSKEIIQEEGIDKCLMKVSLAPHNEGQGTIRVVGTLPADSSGTYSKSKEFFYSAFYPSYTVTVNEDLTQTGAFTRFEGGELYLSDGEEAIFSLKIEEENASGNITGVEWKYGGGLIELTGKENYTTQDRTQLARAIWGVDKEDEIRKIGDGSDYSAQKSLISLTSEQGENGTLFYRLRHNWDFYKDLPQKFTSEIPEGETKSYWEKYLEEEKEKKEEGLIYKSDAFTLLKDAGVDQFLVLYEPLINASNKNWYFIPGDGKDSLAVTWDYYWGVGRDYDERVRGPDKRKRNRYYTELTYGKLWAYASGNDLSTRQILFFENRTKANQWFDVVPFNSSVSYKQCIPYTVSVDELAQNKFFHIPETYNAVEMLYHYRTKWGGDAGSPSHNYRYTYFPITNFRTKNGNMILIPTVTKDKTTADSGTGVGDGQLVVTYANALGETTDRTIIVHVEKRMCEAYTNGNWKKDFHYDHYKFTQEYQLTSGEPGFSVGDAPIGTTEDEYIPLEFTIYPCPAELFVQIPVQTDSYQDYNNKTVYIDLTPTIENAVVVQQDSDTVTYKLANLAANTAYGEHNGAVKIVPKGKYSDELYLYSTVSGKFYSQSVNLTVYNKNEQEAHFTAWTNGSDSGEFSNDRVYSDEDDSCDVVWANVGETFTIRVQDNYIGNRIEDWCWQSYKDTSSKEVLNDMSGNRNDEDDCKVIKWILPKKLSYGSEFSEVDEDTLETLASRMTLTEVGRGFDEGHGYRDFKVTMPTLSALELGELMKAKGVYFNGVAFQNFIPLAQLYANGPDGADDDGNYSDEDLGRYIYIFLKL